MTERKDLQLPLLHLNGSSKGALFTAVYEAHSALNDAIAKLYDSNPNQRDYYPLGDDAWKRALAQHVDRCDRVRAVITELEELATGIDDGGHKS